MDSLKQKLQDAYIQGYRKANIIAGISHGNCEEKTAIKEFNNWYENNHSTKNGD
jgi:hypothetical protein